eukprot:292204_1
MASDSEDADLIVSKTEDESTTIDMETEDGIRIRNKSWSNKQLLIIISICIITTSLLTNIDRMINIDRTNKNCTNKVKGYRSDYGNISVVNLYGNHYEMGVQYGSLLENELKISLDIILDFFMNENGMTYQQLTEQSSTFHLRYSYSYSFFLNGISNASGLPLNDIKILNAMETLQVVGNDDFIVGKCAFISIPPSNTQNNSTLIGRNYDYPPPFDKIAKHLIVTIIHETETETDKIPTAIIAMPGQIYCPSCINKKGIFMELNNGFPSGGPVIDEQRQTLLIKMLDVLQHSNCMNDVKMMMNSFQSDYSLIINVNDPNNNGISYEYSSTLGMKPYLFGETNKNQTFVSTNFFLNDTWTDIPIPYDNNTWSGVTRRQNLLNLTSNSNNISVDDLKDIMDITIENGGAKWGVFHIHTIYQIIFDTDSFSLFLRNRFQPNWQYINLNDFW